MWTLRQDYLYDKHIHRHFRFNLVEPLIISILFLISIPSVGTLAAVTVVASLFLIATNRRGAGAVKSLLFITARSILSTGVASNYGDISMLKWTVVFALSAYCFLTGLKYADRKTRKVIRSLAVFGIALIVIGFYTSGYPVTSAFKVFSWLFVFAAVILCVSANPRVDWIKYLSFYLAALMLFSPVALPMGVAFLRNGHAFQGIINHPNLLGVISALCFTVQLYLEKREHKVWHIVLMALCIVECWFTESRTGMFSIVIIFIMNVLLSSEKGAKRNTMILLLVVVSVVFSLTILGNENSAINRFIYKGHSDILYSRFGQVDTALERFENNPLFGSGFMTPLNPFGKNYELDFDLIFEPGNLIYELLGDLGIVGTIWFALIYLRLYRLTEKQDRVLFAAPFVISMGEMIFFSTNNIAIFYYLLFAVCIAGHKKPLLQTEG